jgi:hypothetical protein
LSPLRALVFEPLLSESVTHSLGFEVGRDSVRAIRRREELGGFIDRKYFVRIECDRQAFESWLARNGMKAIEDPGTNRHMAWHMVSWWPALLRGPQLFANDGYLAPGRGPDGEYFAAFYDEPSGAIHVWLKDNF